MGDLITTGMLFKQTLVTNDEVNAAVAAVLAGQGDLAFRLNRTYTIDLTAAVQANQAVSDSLALPDATPAYRRNLARTAILLAVPVEDHE